MHTINASIQLIPLSASEQAMALIDRAIYLIQESGLRYQVTAFDTQLEGNIEEILGLIRRIYAMDGYLGGQDVVMHVKMHWKAGVSVFMHEKTTNHNSPSS